MARVTAASVAASSEWIGPEGIRQPGGEVHAWQTGTNQTVCGLALSRARLRRFPHIEPPSYRLRPGQVVEVRESSRPKPPFQIAAAGAHADGPTPPYLSTALADLRTTVIREPLRSEIPVICDEQMVVEFYAR